ncbi:hypothetical protein CTI12_AA417400 [Artemisia annua]|uniref:DDE Tnp4 domain-containing protein n=1 Tax=Artemisia annua TaxID=35608 RepID=A0A2U1LR31_ARTAN|nr:hypothetical protein CTI12_AA417400 [Artemisia annua]
MAPIRSNKGKQKVSSSDNIEIRSPGQRSVGQRVVFSNNIAVLVNPRNNVDNFEELFKVSRKTFNHIRSIVKDHMLSLPISYRFQDRKEMSLNDQIAIALRRLSSVDPIINIADLFGAYEPNVFDITWRFVEALEACGRDHISWPRDMATIKSNFEKAGGMPNCCGAIETAYLKMYPHDSEGDTTVWRDREKKDSNHHSMILQVIVDHRLRFVDVVTGFPGSMTKEDVLVESQIYKLAQKRKRLDVPRMKLCEGTELREYLVGGFGFQLRPWLITPYNKKEMSGDETEFDKKQSATGLVANRALDKLKNVWAVIDGGMWSPDRNKLPIIILACCLLHNIVINVEGDGTSNDLMVSKEYSDDMFPYGNVSDVVYVVTWKGTEELLSASMDALLWTLGNSLHESTMVYLVYVFPELRFIPTPLGRLPIAQVNPEQKESYLIQERRKRSEYLQKFLSLCSSAKVQVETVLIESDMEAKAILDLIPILNIKKLVLGATKSSVRKLKSSSKRGSGGGTLDQIIHNAPQFCEVKVICEGKEVSLQDQFTSEPPSPSSTAPSQRDINVDTLKTMQVQQAHTDGFVNCSCFKL